MDVSGGDYSADETMTTVGLGYRGLLHNSAVARIEARYTRWLDDEVDQMSLVLALGAVLGVPD